MTEEYIKRLIELAKLVDEAKNQSDRNQWLQHLIGYISALELIKKEKK